MNEETDLLKLMRAHGFTHRDEGLILATNKYRGVFVRSDGVEFVHEVDAGEVQSNPVELRYLSACSFFDTIKSAEGYVTEEEFRNKQIHHERDFSRPPKPPEGIADMDSYMEGYHQGLWKRPDGGVELRDRFAMAALTGLLSAEPDNEIYDLRVVTLRAYQLADAMLEARGEK
ncbi:MAG: hypothetical protein WCD70_14880 [Alphaproteobacteria bacterium]